MPSAEKLSLPSQILLIVISFALVGFGQPAWNWWSGLLSALFGFALFWRVLLCYSNLWHRFWISTVWFMAVQLVQLSWLISHPYYYIYLLYFLFSFALGMQFGLLGMLITYDNITRIGKAIGIAAIWTLMEWIRLFFFSGYSWNPVGLSLTGSLYALQMASLWGVFGLSFCVMLVNVLALRAWVLRLQWRPVVLCALVAALPYLYGAIHLGIHSKAMADHIAAGHEPFHAVLVQTAFPVEHTPRIDKRSTMEYVIDQWQQILQAVKPHLNKKNDLIVMPEYVVLCGTYTCVFPIHLVQAVFNKMFGADSMQALASLEWPFGREQEVGNRYEYVVNNAFWSQSLANICKTGVVIGLEDAEDTPEGIREYYSAAQYFQPCQFNGQAQPLINRYEKRVLVPMGEYIPFNWCRGLAARYGVTGSFTHGNQAKIFNANGVNFGLSICYEETFGALMCENKRQGAQLLVNLTNDVWYPNSRLPYQHFFHARLRTVENGFPLIRASNLGLTGGIDSLGRVVGMVGDQDDRPEQRFEAIRVAMPMYTYRTLYSIVGDSLIVGLCLVAGLSFFWFGRRK